MKVFLIIVLLFLTESQSLIKLSEKSRFLPTNDVLQNSDLEKNKLKPPSSKATIVKQEFKRFNDGGYRFYYETSEGQSREEVGFFRDDPKLGSIFNVHGSYGYIGPSNKKVFVKYISDERGFRYENSPFPPVGLPSNIINQQLGLYNF